MRTRLAILLALVLAFSSVILTALPALASEGTLILAQQPASEDEAGDADPADQDDESAGGETNSEEGDGQSDADAETGASEDEQAEPEGGEVEAGPVWTYQMSKIVIALLFLMALGIGAAYYKLVVQRQRAGI